MADASTVSLKQEVSKGAIALALTAVLGFGANILFARVLGPEAYGGVFLLLRLSMVLTQPLVGVATACKKRISERGAQPQEIVGFGLGVAIVASAVVVPLAVLFGEGALRAYTGVPHAGALFAALFVATGLYAVGKELLAGTGRMGVVLWIDFAQNLLAKPVQLGLILIGLGATGFVVGHAATALLIVPVFLYVLRERPALPSRTTARSVLAYARYSVPEALLMVTQRRMTLLLLGFLAMPAVAGYYTAASFLTFPAMLIAQPTSDGTMAKVSSLASRGRDVRPTIDRVTAHASLLAIPLTFGALVLAEPLATTIYGSEYAAAGAFVVLLGLYRVFQTQSSTLTGVVRGLDRPDASLRIIGIVLSVNLAVSLGLYVVIGPLGVVVGVVVGEALQYVLTLRVVTMEVGGVSAVSTGIREQVAGGVVMAGVVYAATTLVSPWNPVVLAGLLALGGIVYFGWLWVRWPNFRTQVRETLA